MKFEEAIAQVALYGFGIKPFYFAKEVGAELAVAAQAEDVVAAAEVVFAAHYGYFAPTERKAAAQRFAKAIA